MNSFVSYLKYICIQFFIPPLMNSSVIIDVEKRYSNHILGFLQL